MNEYEVCLKKAEEQRAICEQIANQLNELIKEHDALQREYRAHEMMSQAYEAMSTLAPKDEQ